MSPAPPESRRPPCPARCAAGRACRTRCAPRSRPSPRSSAIRRPARRPAWPVGAPSPSESWSRTWAVGSSAPYCDAAEHVFSAAGYDVLLYNLGSPETRKRFFTKMPVRKRVDAVLSLLIPDDRGVGRTARTRGAAGQHGRRRPGGLHRRRHRRPGRHGERRTASGEPRPPPDRHDQRVERAAALDHARPASPGVPRRAGRGRDRARSGPRGGRRLHRRGRRARHDRTAGRLSAADGRLRAVRRDGDRARCAPCAATG